MRRKMPTWVTNVKRPRGSTSWKGPAWHTIKTIPGCRITTPKVWQSSHERYPLIHTPSRERGKTIKGSNLSSSEQKLLKKPLWISMMIVCIAEKVLLFFVTGSQLLRQFQKLPHLSAAFPFDIYRSRRLLLRPWRWGPRSAIYTSTIQKSRETCCHSDVDV